MNTPLHKDDFGYAFEASKIIREPDRFIDTFGLTRFDFLVVSELMDSVGQVRVRSGVIEAQKPIIIKPEAYSEIEFDGFSAAAQGEAQKILDWLKNKGENLAFLRYGFEFKKSNTREEIIHDPLESVLHRLKEDAEARGNPALAIIEGVDDTWEVALFKFTLQMIRKSTEVNVSDYQRNGLL